MKRVLINHWLLIYVLIMLFFSAILKDDKDDDNLTFVSKAFQNETPILEIENFFLCKVNMEIEIILFAKRSREVYLY